MFISAADAVLATRQPRTLQLGWRAGLGNGVLEAARQDGMAWWKFDSDRQ